MEGKLEAAKNKKAERASTHLCLCLCAPPHASPSLIQSFLFQICKVVAHCDSHAFSTMTSSRKISSFSEALKEQQQPCILHVQRKAKTRITLFKPVMGGTGLKSLLINATLTSEWKRGTLFKPVLRGTGLKSGLVFYFSFSSFKSFSLPLSLPSSSLSLPPRSQPTMPFPYALNPPPPCSQPTPPPPPRGVFFPTPSFSTLNASPPPPNPPPACLPLAPRTSQKHPPTQNRFRVSTHVSSPTPPPNPPKPIFTHPYPPHPKQKLHPRLGKPPWLPLHSSHMRNLNPPQQSQI
ncbi:hypothetical protein Fmac_018238 [Flemingia macrophylla]|uniref:Uncharacterized protein n=1 Tax=Flemingia macrophylla TaxID=520843 RepID=A0ABD1M4D2_9FABA